MIKSGHRMKGPFNLKKMASYFKGKDLIVYETEEHLLIEDRFVCFKVDLHEAITEIYRPEKKHQTYIIKDGVRFIEENCHNIFQTWEMFLKEPNTHIVFPTDYFYQPREDLLVRKFTNEPYREDLTKEPCVSWVLKTLSDILALMAIDLDYHFRFEQLYGLGNSLQKRPMRVSFRKVMQDPWTVVAIIMPWVHEEKKGK